MICNVTTSIEILSPSPAIASPQTGSTGSNRNNEVLTVGPQASTVADPLSAKLMTRDPSSQIGKIVREDTLQCYSRNRALYRLLLTESEIYFQSLKYPEQFERYALEDLFGVQTYRHKKKSSEGNGRILGSSAAYVCFTLYPRMKRGLISTSKVREKLQVVFQIQKPGCTFEENLNEASAWKDTALALLRTKFSKWQLEKLSNEYSDSSDAGSPQRVEKMARRPEDDWTRGEKDNIDITTHELAISLSSQALLLRKFLVIVNPKSGQGKTLSIFKDFVYPILCESGVKTILFVTERPGHAQALTYSKDLSDFGGIVTVGGDGLLYEVVNGLRSRPDAHTVADIPVGVIAGGSGNGLARSIASYSGESEDYFKNPVLETTLAVARGHVLPVNLLEVDIDARKVYAFLSVGWGILADIDIESEVIRPIGESRFALWSLLRVAKLRTYNAQINYSLKTGEEVKGQAAQVDGRVVEGNFVSVYASCQSHIGSDIIFAPQATPNDGLIHLTIAKGDIGRARITQFLLGLAKGSHVNVPGVEYVKVKEFSIYAEGGIQGTVTLDGEKVLGQKVVTRLASKPLNVFAL